MCLQGLPTITKMVTEAKTAPPASSNSTNSSAAGLSAAHRAEPTMALNLVVSLLAIVCATRLVVN